MPTYNNGNTSVINVEGIRIEPGQTVTTYQYLTALPSGVTLTAATPYFDNVISSAALAGATTVTVPSTVLGNYKIVIYVSSGTCTVKINNTSAIARNLGLNEKLELTCMTRIIDNVIVTPTGTTNVTIEKI